MKLSLTQPPSFVLLPRRELSPRRIGKVRMNCLIGRIRNSKNSFKKNTMIEPRHIWKPLWYRSTKNFKRKVVA